jgi:hypothetical protein
MKTMKLGVILLAFLLAAMVMVPMVNAAEQNATTASAVDVSKIQLPQLQFNNSQTQVIVTGELSPEPNMKSAQGVINAATSGSASVSGVPYGSIIYHSKSGVTTVFDSTGKQLFAAEDSKAALVNTPKGPLPATGIHEVPSGSVVSSDGKNTMVTYQGRVLFREIDEKSNAQQTNSLVTAQAFSIPPGYVEGIEGSPTSQNVGYYSTTWRVPIQPSHTNSNSGAIYLFNGVQTTTGRSLLIQPVLAWRAESQAAWSIESVFMYGDTTGVHSTRRYGVSEDHQIQGTMTYNAQSKLWTMITLDNSNGLSTSLTVSNSMPNSGVVINAWLEDYQPGQNRYICGSTTFNNFVVRDTSNNNIRPSSVTRYIQSDNWPYLTGLDVRINNWPTSITLKTNPQ